MKTIIGTVEKVEGKFFAKDISGKVTMLHVGDKITSDMLVYGDKSNSASATIQVAMVELGKIIYLTGTEEQLFDASLSADLLESEGIHFENLNAALAKTIQADKDTAQKDANDDLAVLDDTAAGQERAKSTDTVEGVFASRDGASTDINSDLRDAAFATPATTYEPSPIIIQTENIPAVTPDPATANLSLSGATTTEEGQSVTYTLTLSETLTNDTSVEITISNITTNGDIVEKVVSVTIPAGTTSVSFVVDNIDDTIKENPEDYNVAITNVENTGNDQITIVGKEVITTITDESDPSDLDVGATISITGDTSVIEGNAASYTLHTDTISSEDIVVTVVTGHITTQNGDYIPVTQDVVIPAGESSISFTVQTTDDNLAEPTEFFNVSITAVSAEEFEAVSISPSASTVETGILENDKPTISINDMTVNEDAGFMTFTVTLSNPSTSTISVDYHTSNGTATAALDYTAVTGTVTFVPGETTQTIIVPIKDDFIDEGSETLDVVLTNPLNATITDNTGLGIIIDEPTPAPEDTITVTLSGDASVTEGATANYTVTLSQTAITDMDVDVVIGHETTDNGDLIARTITVTVSAGSNHVDFSVANNDDVYAEGDEVYKVTLSGVTTGGGFEAVDVDTTPVSTAISDNTIPGTEVDDEIVNIRLSGADTVEEGASATYTITLDEPTRTPMQVEVQTGHITTDNGDLIPTTIMVTIPANSNTASFTVANTQDNIKEGNEDYSVVLTGVSVGGNFETLNVDTTPVTTTINDDEVLSIRINNVTVNEDAGTMTFTVSLSTLSASDVTFDYASADQSAVDGMDYTAVNGSGIITAGSMTTTIVVPITDDYIAEPNETFLINLSNVTPGVIVADGQGVGTITDEPTPNAADTVTVSLSGSSDVIEGENATYLVTTDKAVVTDMTVDVSYSFISAETGDIITNTVQVTIPAGTSASAAFDVVTVDDVYAEGDEVFNVTISNPQGGSVEKIVLGTTTVATTIHDDTTPGTEPTTESALVSITGALDVAEGNAASYTVSVDNPTTAPLTVDISYSYTSAESGDIVTNTTQVTIAANTTSVQFDVATIDDAYAEGDEVFNVSISNPQGGGFENVAVDSAKATVATTIHDNTIPGTETDAEVINVVLSGPSTVAEGGTATYTITLDEPAATLMQVEVQTGHQTTDNGDLIPTTMMVTIPAGQLSATFLVTNADDTITEGAEIYTVTLTGLTTGGGFETTNVDTTPVPTTIIDNEGVPSITIDDVIVNEDAGTMSFTVTLSNATISDVTFDYASADKSPLSAEAGKDYIAVSGSGVIAAGETTTTIVVPIIDDYITETSEKFFINLSNASTNAVIADAQGVGTITDEPTPGTEDTVTVTLSGDANVEESNAANYTVSTDKPVATDLSVTIITGHVTTENGDYVVLSTVVTIPAGQSSVSFSVQTNDDAYAEGAEDYTVTMSNPLGGGVENIALGNTVVTTTINDETSPASEDTATVSISGSTTVVEGNTATYTVSVDKIPTTDLFVNVTTGHITTEDGDYTPVSTTVKIAAGTTSAQFSVDTIDDALAEVTEDYRVSITGTNGGGFEKTIIGVSQVKTAITDETNPQDKDAGATVSLSGDASVWEGNTATYTVTTDTVSTSDIIVTVQTQ
ncbi:MAG: Calx-beta domain-containing protein, partial [Sulfurimonas sp.]|nr:Calx-beta domain-containing protein [Sulfurimonas sp.]